MSIAAIVNNIFMASLLDYLFSDDSNDKAYGSQQKLN